MCAFKFKIAKVAQERRWKKHFPTTSMEVVVKKTRLDKSSSPRGGAGVKCLLYEARKQPNYDPVRENTFTSELSRLDPNLFQLLVHKMTVF